MFIVYVDLAAAAAALCKISFPTNMILKSNEKIKKTGKVNFNNVF